MKASFDTKTGWKSSRTQTLFPLDAPVVEPAHDLCQYFTPRWAAEALLEQLGELVPGVDHVLEPCAGSGSFVSACPDDVAVTAIEKDPEIAQLCAQNTGRPVITADFRDVDLDVNPTVIITNPPFESAIITSLANLAREMLPIGGRFALVLPTSSLSFARKTRDLIRGFEVEISLLPRDLYPRIRLPLLFAKMRRTRETKLIGFLLFEESVALRSMRAEYRHVLNDGRQPLWREVVEMALRALGGSGTLDQIYATVENFRPTANRFWRDKIRQEAARCAERVEPGRFRLRAAA